MGRLVAANYPANLFIVNPSVASGGSYLVTDWGKSFYDAAQIEYRRRMASGLTIQANYVLSKSLVDGATASGVVYSEPTTFRNLGLDKVPAGFDVRNAFKINFIYELPFGTGRHFLSGNSIANKIFGGWQISAIERSQSGTPSQVTAGSQDYTMNTSDDGVVLENMTTKQLQSMMSIYKTTASTGFGQVWFLPKAFVNNSQAAFEANGFNWTNTNVTSPYVSRQLAPNSFGYRIYLYGPWQNHFDTSIMKRITFAHEKANMTIQANCLDCLNLTNFYAGTVNPSSGSFGITTSAYSDISNSQDPGSRVIDFIVRVNF